MSESTGTETISVLENGKRVRKKVAYVIRYEVINEDGDMMISYSQDGKALEALEYTGRNTATGVQIYRGTGKTSTLVKPSYAEEGPYRAFFLYSGMHATDVARQNGTIAADEFLNAGAVRNPYRNASSRITYYYTKEIAEVVFKDITNGADEVLETITGTSGKGESEITKALVKAQTTKDVEAILAGYLGNYYRLAEDGDDFGKNPTFNAQTIDVNPKDTPEESAEREKARREANKKLVEIRLEKIGSVVVKYVTEEGAALKDTLKLKDRVLVGEAYDATQNKDETIKTPDNKVYEFVLHKADSLAENGTVAQGENEVVYVYKEVQGKVLVNYYSETGEVIKPQEVALAPSSNGTAYDAENLKVGKITTDDGRVFKFKEVKADSDPVSGTLNVEEKREYAVNYVYEEVKSTVEVKYVDEQGNEIKAPAIAVENVSVGSDYDTNAQKLDKIVAEDGRVYTLVPERTDGAEAGKVAEDKTTITYVYREVKSSVEVKYVDEQGTEIKAPVNAVEDASVGSDYNTEAQKLEKITTSDGKVYELVPASTQGEEAGKVAEDKTTVTYVYKEVKANVLVNYYNEAGEVIKPQASLEPLSNNSPYDAESLKDEKIVAADGKVYRYKTLKADSDKVSGAVNVEEKRALHVNYVYEEVKSSVEVQYVDETGKALKAPVVILPEASVGTDYTVGENKLNQIVTPDGRVYVLVANENKDTGKVGEEKTIITYIYKEVINSSSSSIGVGTSSPTIDLPVKDKENSTSESPVKDNQGTSSY